MNLPGETTTGQETEKHPSAFVSGDLVVRPEDVTALLAPTDEIKGFDPTQLDNDILTSRIYREMEESGSEGAIIWIIDETREQRSKDKSPDVALPQTSRLTDLLVDMPTAISTEKRAKAWKHLLDQKWLGEKDVLIVEQGLEVVCEEDDDMHEPTKQLFDKTLAIFEKIHELKVKREEFMQSVVSRAVRPNTPTAPSASVDSSQEAQTV